MSLTNYENFQVYGILKASPSTYSHRYAHPAKTLSTGSQVTLVAAVQGRNNGRAILTGSLDMFSNELYQKR